jgi:hypothetical protein
VKTGKGTREAMFWSGWGVEGSLQMICKAGLEVKVRDMVADANGTSLLWILARKGQEEGLCERAPWASS